MLSDASFDLDAPFDLDAARAAFRGTTCAQTPHVPPEFRLPAAAKPALPPKLKHRLSRVSDAGVEKHQKTKPRPAPTAQVEREE